MRQFVKAFASAALVHPEIFGSSRPSLAVAFTRQPSSSIQRFASQNNLLTSSQFAPRFFSSSTTKSMATSFYDLSGTKSDGTELSMGDFKGKVVYATNVASQ